MTYFTQVDTRTRLRESKSFFISLFVYNFFCAHHQFNTSHQNLLEQEGELERLRREKLQREEIELYHVSIVKEEKEEKRKTKGLTSFAYEDVSVPWILFM